MNLFKALKSIYTTDQHLNLMSDSSAPVIASVENAQREAIRAGLALRQEMRVPCLQGGEIEVRFVPMVESDLKELQIRWTQGHHSLTLLSVPDYGEHLSVLSHTMRPVGVPNVQGVSRFGNRLAFGINGSYLISSADEETLTRALACAWLSDWRDEEQASPLPMIDTLPVTGLRSFHLRVPFRHQGVDKTTHEFLLAPHHLRDLTVQAELPLLTQLKERVLNGGMQDIIQMSGVKG